MIKSDYKNPTMLVVEIQQRQHFLKTSDDPAPGPSELPTREYQGGAGDEGSNSSSNNVWDKEW